MKRPNGHRFRTGDISSRHPGRVFLRYSQGRERWGTPEKLLTIRRQHNAVDAKQRKKPGYKEQQKIYARTYNHRPHVKASHAAYWKQPHVRERLKKRWNASSTTLKRRKQRSEQRMLWEEFKKHPEYKELLLERGRDCYRKRALAGKLRVYYANKRRTDLNYRVKNSIVGSVNSALRRSGTPKCKRLTELIGCTIPEFRSHIEKQFAEGMTWANMGAWEIDHRVPIASFNLADPEQQKLAFNFHNCQPLWKPANRQKSDKIEIDGEVVRGRHLRGQHNIIPFPKQVAA